MKLQPTWPGRSDGSRFSSLPLSKMNGSKNRNISIPSSSRQIPFCSRPSEQMPDFSALPYDVVAKIAGSFSLQNLRSASLVCKSWCEALRPLREAMLFFRWGKRFKHGRGGVRPNLHKALDSFLKGAARGSTLAMVDAGLIYWELGKKDKALALYHKAAALGDPAGQCNLAISYLQAESPNTKEALKWLYKASLAGHTRAQYQFALCLHQGRGTDPNIQEAARWYLKAAESGYVRAMYNVSLCYSFGEGLVHSHRHARKWMKRAADRGHTKAQLEHGLALFSVEYKREKNGQNWETIICLSMKLGCTIHKFSTWLNTPAILAFISTFPLFQEGEMMKAVVYLELATRAGERAAAHVKNVILQQLSANSRDRVMFHADNWRALPSSR